MRIGSCVGPASADAARSRIQRRKAPAPAPASQDFEMKTREMSAVDLEALGLAQESNATTPFQRVVPT